MPGNQGGGVDLVEAGLRVPQDGLAEIYDRPEFEPISQTFPTALSVDVGGCIAPSRGLIASGGEYPSIRRQRNDPGSTVRSSIIKKGVDNLIE